MRCYLDCCVSMLKNRATGNNASRCSLRVSGTLPSGPDTMTLEKQIRECQPPWASSSSHQYFLSTSEIPRLEQPTLQMPLGKDGILGSALGKKAEGSNCVYERSRKTLNYLNWSFTRCDKDNLNHPKQFLLVLEKANTIRKGPRAANNM